MKTSPPLPAEAIIERLDTLIATTSAASIPVQKRWLDAAGVAALLSVSHRLVRDRLASRPDFPRPLKIGHPRWKASEILEWAEQQRQHPPRRPHKRAASPKNTAHHGSA